MDCLRGRVKGNARESETVQATALFHARPTHQPTQDQFVSTVGNTGI
jgi:hypothetical protein